MYFDADFEANRDDWAFMGGQIILLDKAPITWRSLKLRSVSLSIMLNQVLWLKSFSGHLCQKQNTKTVMAMQVKHKQVLHKQTKGRKLYFTKGKRCVCGFPPNKLDKTVDDILKKSV